MCDGNEVKGSGKSNMRVLHKAGSGFSTVRTFSLEEEAFFSLVSLVPNKFLVSSFISLNCKIPIAEGDMV